MSSEQRIEKQDCCCIFHRFCFAPSHIFMSPTSFSPLSPSPSVSSLCPSACLSHSAAAVSILYSVCYFWMKPSSRAASLWAALKPDHNSLTVAVRWPCSCTEKACSWHLTEREKQRDRDETEKNIQWHKEVFIATDVLWLQKQRPETDWLLIFLPFFSWRHAVRIWNMAQPLLYNYNAGSWES